MKKNLILLSIIILMSLFILSCNDTTKPTDKNGDGPKISSISPTETYRNSILEIRGKNFDDEQNDNFVEINGAKVIITGYKVWSDTFIKVIVPNNATTGNVIVRVNGNSSNGVKLTIKESSLDDPPLIKNFDVDKPFVRTAIGIEGNNFGDEQGQSYVMFNGIISKINTYWSNKKIVAMIPSTAVSGDVIVYVQGIASNSKYLEIREDILLLEQVLIPAGSFIMGTNDEPEAWNSPPRDVAITNPFYMSTHEINQKSWEAVMWGYNNPSRSIGDLKPVERVTWIRACEFCNALSNRERFDEVYTIDGSNISINWEANGYRLPTEAEWEYAARAGGSYKYGLGTDGKNGLVGAMAWFLDNADNDTHPVGDKEANAFGLYDMLGNVSEWCWDLFDTEYYSTSGNNTDPRGPESTDTEQRVLRGSDYLKSKQKTTVSYRWGADPQYGAEFYIGYRVVRNAE